MDTGEVKDTVIRLKVTQGNIISVDGQETEGQYLNAVLLKGFLKLQPKALGVMHLLNTTLIIIIHRFRNFLSISSRLPSPFTHVCYAIMNETPDLSLPVDCAGDDRSGGLLSRCSAHPQRLQLSCYSGL